MGIGKLDKEDFLKSFLVDVLHISDKKYQQRIWIKGLGPECDDFEETVNSFFDFGETILKYYKDFNITETQYQMVYTLRTEFERFFFSPSRPSFPDEFIDMPEWTKITKMAKEVLEAFHWQASP